ncbi:hypothetical protein CC2G_015117 [Coprinopsis cinerea AmutBmut pab1-1]|nr:hypothetical protein CC2G_015117 [Coprinopsis cinerea AmutBmut pab1-1]
MHSTHVYLISGPLLRIHDVHFAQRACLILCEVLRSRPRCVVEPRGGVLHTSCIRASTTSQGTYQRVVEGLLR